MAWHKPVFSDSQSEQLCSLCGAKRLGVGGLKWGGLKWGRWYNQQTGNIVSPFCPGPPKVLDAIIVSERQRPGLIIDEGGKP